MNSKRSREGYLLIDHSASGLPTFESATITCSHCCRIVVLNPDRSRERGYCPKCDSYVCDQCNLQRTLTGQCRPFVQIVEETQERAARIEQLTRLGDAHGQT
jgi:hypothetical protein